MCRRWWFKLLFIFYFSSFNFFIIQVITTGGNANGKPCRFPFKYNSIDHYQCTYEDAQNLNNKKWCRTNHTQTCVYMVSDFIYIVYWRLFILISSIKTFGMIRVASWIKEFIIEKELKVKNLYFNSRIYFLSSWWNKTNI